MDIIYIYNKTTNEKIVDFQMIYLTDSRIHLEFYADGQIEEAQTILNEHSVLKKLDYALLKGNKEEVDIYEKRVSEKLKDLDFVLDITLESMDSINKMTDKNSKIEQDINDNTLDINKLLDYYWCITKMMSFRRLSELCDPKRFSENVSNYEKSILQISIPSHLLILHNELMRLSEDPNEEAIEKFICDYGYLASFNIERSELETVEGVRNSISNKQTNDNFKAVYNFTEVEGISDKGVIVFYRLGWCDEMRHMQQQRALRNFRLIFERLGLDIYRSTVNDCISLI